MEDERIIELYMRRDEAAVRRTAEKYGRRLRTLSMGIVGDWQTAEECENDAYLEAWNSIPPHEPKGYFYAFLACITRRLSLNRCRERGRLKRSALVGELSAELEQCIPSPDEALPSESEHTHHTSHSSFPSAFSFSVFIKFRCRCLNGYMIFSGLLLDFFLFIL